MGEHRIDVKAAFLLTQAAARTVLLNDLKARPRAYRSVPGYATEALAERTAWEAVKSGQFERVIKATWDVLPLVDHATDVIQLSGTGLEMEYCPDFYGRAVNCLTRRPIDIGHSTVTLFLPPGRAESLDWDGLVREYAGRLSKFMGTDFPFEEHVFDVAGTWNI